MGSKARAVLIASMGGLLLFNAAGGAAALVMLGQMRATDAVLRTRFEAANRRLEQIRGAIYLSGTLARDYFFDPAGPQALERLERETFRNLETPEAAGMRAEASAYFRVIDFMIEVEGKRTAPGVDAWFRRQLAGRRAAMLNLADAASAALATEWREAQREREAMYSHFRWALGGTLALALSLGLVVAAVTLRRVGALEARARHLAGQLAGAQEQERRSIARELHDGVGQSLNAALLEAGTAGLRARLEEAVAGVRRIALALRPSMLDDLGLVAALEWQAREIGNRSGLDVRVTAEESAGEMPDALRTCIFRVAQEALHNCERHSGAKQVQVSLEHDGRSVTLQVEDNGRGFAVARTRGLGLLGMDERVTQLGGVFRVRSQPGQGTVVTAELPV
jgi:signal transduction histidine kinase